MFFETMSFIVALGILLPIVNDSDDDVTRPDVVLVSNA